MRAAFESTDDQYAVLLDQVLEHVLLLDVDPAREREEQDSQRVGVGRQRAIVARC